MDNNSIAKLSKEKGNIAFKAKDYATARSLYSHAMTFDQSNHLYPLNRCMANLKLERWDEAEADATKTLDLCPRNLKALFRRGKARKELGKWDRARVDIRMFIDNEGDPTLGAQELKAITAAESLPPFEPSSYISSGLESDLANLHLQDDSDSSFFGIYTSAALQKGKGAFTSRDIQRGGLILSERPIFSMPIVTNLNAPDPLRYIFIDAAVQKLSPAHLDGYLSLQNSHNKCSCFRSPLFGIFGTNSFAVSEGDSGICLRASRINHSCSPNAHFVFNSGTGEHHFLALRSIPRGEEISISYISRRSLYGSPRRLRQAILRRAYHFTCACSVCSLSEAESKMSDVRRQRVNELWEIIGRLTPTMEEEDQCSSAAVEACVEGIRLLQEEGELVDADGFMKEASTPI
ncbi:hypothetical protein V8E53_009778 [Lactarius tabidus]